jgi:hypothetical protein
MRRRQVLVGTEALETAAGSYAPTRGWMGENDAGTQGVDRQIFQLCAH